MARALKYSESSLETIGKLFISVPVEWTDRKQIPVRSENGVEQLRELLIISEQGLEETAVQYGKDYDNGVIATLARQ